MNVTVVGAGYVGLVTATCLAEIGHQVTGVDHDFGRVALLQGGGIPIYEPGLQAMLRSNMEAERLSFTTSLAQAMATTEVVFIAVGTPPQEDGSADLRHVLNVAAQIGQHAQDFVVVVNKSTVPVGTGAKVQDVIHEQLARRGRTDLPFAVVSNPEFLKEGAAIDDFMHPDRIVIGVPNSAAGDRARSCLAALYAPFNRHHERTVWMDVPSAELTKYAANAMLATRISFMNEVANLADRLGADVDAVRRGIGADRRIGHSFLYAGTGYGGSCFPKDTRALQQTAASVGLRMEVVEAVERVNQAQKLALLRAVEHRFGTNLSGLRFAVWGLAFKPNTDDMREAPSRGLICELIQQGAHVSAYDPVAMHEAKRAFSADLGHSIEQLDRLQFADDPLEATEGADALLVLTEWKCFHNPDFEALRARMRRPLILDGRNLYDPQRLQMLGWAYQGIGRHNALGKAHLLPVTPKQTWAASPVVRTTP